MNLIANDLDPTGMIRKNIKNDKKDNSNVILPYDNDDLSTREIITNEYAKFAANDLTNSNPITYL